MRPTSLLFAVFAVGVASALGGCFPLLFEGADDRPVNPGPGCRIEL